MSDALLVQCPSCGQPALKKLISAAGFRLGGSGWYETDFKKTGKRNLVENESKESKESAKPKDSAKSGDSKASDSGKSKQPSSASGSKPAASGT